MKEPKLKRIETMHPDGEPAVIFEPEDETPSAPDLSSPRSTAEGKADAAKLAALLDVSEAEAVRRATHEVLKRLEGGKQ